MSDPQKNLAQVAFHVAKERYGAAEDKTAPAKPEMWKEYTELERWHPFAVVQAKNFAPDQLTTPAGEELEPWVKCAVKPLLDEPLRDPSICRMPDGRYLLTGTGGVPDFQNCLTIRLWESADAVHWTPLGTVFDLSDPATCRHPDRRINYWMRFACGNPDGEPNRGIAAPRIHFLKGTYWITFSINEQGSGILKSLSGRPEGPYESAVIAAGRTSPERLTMRSGTPSLFEDVDPAGGGAGGAVYAVWDEGWIARMQDDLTGWAERPRLLTVEPESPFDDYPLYVGRRGAFIARMQGKYVLVGEDINPRLGGNPCHDTFVAVADSLFGPYGKRRLLVPHGGASTLFQDHAGRWFAAGSGHPDDAYALCRDRAFIVPIHWDHGLGFPYRRLWTVTEAGPVGRLKPGIDVAVNRPVEIRDPQALMASDDWCYVAGTVRKNEAGVAGIRLWRSQDFTRWEPVRGTDGSDFVWLTTQSSWATQKADHPGIEGPECRVWGAQLFEHDGTYFIPFMTWPFHQTGILRSVSGKPEGPYEETGFVYKDGAPHLFKDDDGQVWIYFCFGPTRLAPLNRELTKMTGPLADVTYVNDRQQGYEGSWILKCAGKYILFQSDWWGEDKLQRQVAKSCPYGYARYGTYDWMYSVSDHIRGPYGRPRLAVPHGGTCSVIQAPDGRWLASVFCGDSTAPFACSLAFIPLDIREENGNIQITVLPPEP